MPYLDVEGASLYYETLGSGPVLLCITGAGGSVEFYKPVAEYLKEHFTLIMYDRRGYSRSHLTGAQDYANRIATDASDAAALIAHTSSRPSAYVFGNSSGALVALHLLANHPANIRTLVAHEPPLHCVLPDLEELKAIVDNIYATYRAGGIIPALDVFASWAKMDEGERGAMQAAMDPRTGGPHAFANAMYWFERETDYPRIQVSIEALEKEKSKLVLACGKETHEDSPAVRPNLILAERLGLEVRMVEGAHLAPVSHAEGFAKDLVSILGE